MDVCHPQTVSESRLLDVCHPQPVSESRLLRLYYFDPSPANDFKIYHKYPKVILHQFQTGK